jgi:soluble lytic murein transglycosylase-like protein
LRAPRFSGLAGANLAVAGFAAALVFPASLADGPRPLAPAEREVPACALDRPCDPGREGWIDRVDARLTLRVPALADEDRARLAETIVDEAAAARIDPLLVLALIEVESSYDPRAISVAGARGLMQLLPTTMRSEAERSRIAFADPHDPVANVQAGVRYLRRLIDAFGREEVALMAYNAGPNRILGYLREGGVPELFRDYPRRVKAEHRRLRRAFGVEVKPALAEIPRRSVVQ